MNITHPIKKGNAGMALLTALIFITVTVLVLTAMTARYVQQRLVVDRFEDYYVCFEAAEAAIEQGRVALLSYDFDFRVGIPESWEPDFDDNNNLIMPSLDDDGIVPASFHSVPEVEYIVYVHEWYEDGRDTNGDGTIDSDAEMGFFSIHALAGMNGHTRQIEAVYSSHDIGVWRNAIFAGSGQAGGLINGNVSVAGSVHLLGEDLPAGGMAVSALDMSGTSLIHNNYDGIPANLGARVPPLNTTIVDGEEVPTLEATLRVKNGLVGLSGNSMVGEPPSAGAKRTMDGVFVNDGWTGNSTVDGVPTMVFSDNSWEEQYDLGNRVGFPVLSDYWRDPEGNLVHNPNTGDWYTHEEYFTEQLAGQVYEGDVVIDAASSDEFYFNVDTGEYEHLPPGQAGSPEERAARLAEIQARHEAGENSIFKPADSDKLYINGQIKIDGDLIFTGQGNQRTLHYEGRAALFVTGDVTIDANLLTYDVGPAAFPVNNCLGIMTPNNMMVGGSAQLSIMGAFYAEQQISTQRQTNVMGTFVSNYFNMGTNVPSIFQVPTLADNLPLGMIGNYPILNMRSESWREIGV